MSKIFIYREPKNKELGFELLEGPNEGVANNSPQNPAPAGNSDNNKKNIPKKPKNVQEWNQNKNQSTSQSQDISAELDINLAVIKQRLGMPKNQDISIREFKIGRKIKAFIVFVDGMVDKKILNNTIFPQLMSKDISEELDMIHITDFLIENILTVHSIKKENQYSVILNQVLNGVSALFIDGCTECILIETRGYDKRSIDSPKTEIVVKGSQEGFTENLRTNLTMIRRIIKSEKLVTEMLLVNSTNNAYSAILYLDGVANPKVIEEVKKRIGSIKTDFILGDGMVEQFIEDNSFVLFPQVISTERPDRTASFIMEGQVVIMVEGTPFSMAVPVTFFRLLHTSEDSFARWPYGSFLRFIRLFGLFCATLLPGLYISIIIFHPEMIPTELVASISEAKESVPFPTIIEVLIMEFSFELIREGGIRVPTVIGQTLGIVGALILGQAAVSAGLVSPILVIIVSVTALGSFAIPNYSLSLAVRIERFAFILAGALLGFYGVALMFFIIMASACSMKSFGVPFMAPLAPRTKVNPDMLIRAPVWMHKKRPDGLQSPDRKKQGNNEGVWVTKENKNSGGNSHD